MIGKALNAVGDVVEGIGDAIFGGGYDDMSDEELLQTAMRNNPAFAKRVWEMQDQQRQQQQRQQYMNKVMGNKAQQQVVQQQRQLQEGPMQPGVQRQMQTVNQITQPARPGAGYLGGKMSDKELALRLMGAPTEQMRTTGGNLITALLKPGQARQPTDYELYQRNPQQYSQWKAAGRAPQQPQKPSDFELYQRNPEAYSRYKQAGGQGNPGIKDTVTMENTLRDDFNSQAKDFQKMQSAYERIQTIEPTAIGDTALVFSWMKMQDPSSTVSAGEQATVSNSSSMFSQGWQLYNKLTSGETLTTKQREDIKRQTGLLYNNSLDRYKTLRNQYGGMAKRYKLNPENIIGNDFSPYPIKKKGPNATGKLNNEGDLGFKDEKKGDGFTEHRVIDENGNEVTRKLRPL